MFDKLVEQKIREAMKAGEFDDLEGKGRPINLDAYFSTPEELRAGYAVLKNAGVLRVPSTNVRAESATSTTPNATPTLRANAARVCHTVSIASIAAAQTSVYTAATISGWKNEIHFHCSYE